MSTPHLPNPEVRLLTSRLSGLELYQVWMPPLSPLALLVRPGDRAQLGGWGLEEAMVRLELGTPPLLAMLIQRVVSAVLPACRARRCQELAIRIECSKEGLPVPGPLIMPGFYCRYRYIRLSSEVAPLRVRVDARIVQNSPVRVHTSPLSTGGAGQGTLWHSVPDFPPWFIELFKSIFTPGTDQEIAEAIPFQLTLLELILAAAWQQPSLQVLWQGDVPVGMILSRALLPDKGELSFVGLTPAVRGQRNVGCTLMDAGLRPLEAAGIEQVVCAVATDNPRSLAFFCEKWGFTEVGTEEVWSRQVG